MRMTRLAAVVAVICLGAWIGSAQAQQDQQAQQKAQHAQQEAQQAKQQAQQGVSGQQGMGGSAGGMSQQGQAGQHPAPGLLTSPNEMQVQGKILGESKDVNVQGDKEHRVVRVQTRGGQTMMVDLGRADRIPDGFKVREGQWVIVTGVQGQLGNDQVLIAHNVANVFNFLPAAAARSGAQLEDQNQSLQEKVGGNENQQGTGGSSGQNEDNLRAQYRDYPGHVGQSGPGGSQQQQDSNQNH